MARLASSVGLLAMVCGGPAAHAQGRCDAPTQNEWLTNSPAASGSYVEVAADLIQPVTANLPEAIERLAKAPFVLLTPEDVAHFGGRAAADAAPAGGGRGRLYLVRAVYPSPSPTIGVSWNGPGLFVFAGGLGCGPFVKQPIIVLLDREPVTVDVRASSAL